MDHLIKNIKINIVQSKKGKYLLNINNRSLKTPDGNIIELPSRDKKAVFENSILIFFINSLF